MTTTKINNALCTMTKKTILLRYYIWSLLFMKYNVTRNNLKSVGVITSISIRYLRQSIDTIRHIGFVHKTSTNWHWQYEIEMIFYYNKKNCVFIKTMRNIRNVIFIHKHINLRHVCSLLFNAIHWKWFLKDFLIGSEQMRYPRSHIPHTVEM